MKNIHFKAGLLALGALIGFSGCSQGNSPENNETPADPTAPAAEALLPGNYQRNIMIGTDSRSYILHVPTNYDGSAALPLVFVLHGYGGSAQSMVKLTAMNTKADSENFFVAYLQGTYGDGEALGWNSGMTPELGFTVDDVAFVRDLADQLESELGIDAKRIYAAGFSNGAFMSHRLASELSDVLAAVAPVAGTIGISPDEGTTWNMIPEAKDPIPMLIIHGELDDHVPYYGGQGLHIYDKSVPDAVAFWTATDGCTEAPEITTSPDGNITTTDYKACTEGSEVEQVKVANGYHEWPTAEGHTGFSATDAIWDFFSRHSL